MAHRFNTPPGWPTPPPGWTPPAGWQPDPSWPSAPPGWQFWVEDAPPSAPPPPPVDPADPAATTPLAAGAPGAPIAGAPQSPQSPSPEAGAAGPGRGNAAPGGSGDATVAVPTYPGAGYSSAPAPYATDPVVQPFASTPIGQASGATSPVPSYAPGGHATGAAGPYSGVPGSPGGPADPGGDPAGAGGGGKRTLVIILVVLAVLIVGIIIAVAASRGSGGAEPSTPATTEEATETDEPTEPAEPTETEEPTEPAEPTETEEPTEPTEPTETEEPTQPSAPGVPVGWVEVALGSAGTLYDFDNAAVGTLAVNSVEWDATCDGGSFDTGPDNGSYVLLNVTAAGDPGATEPLSINPFFWQAYAEGHSSTVGWAIFCTVPDELPDEIQPGATASGNIMLDISTDTVWLGYSPTFGITKQDPIWRVN